MQGSDVLLGRAQAAKKGVPQPSAEDVLAYVKPRVASWWLPDAVVFIDAIPHTATGKIDKKVLRQRFGDAIAPPSKL